MYIGSKKIQSETQNGEFIDVTFEDNTSEKYNKEILELVKTKKESDATTVRNIKCERITKDILALFLHYNIKTSEVQHVMALVINSVNQSETGAVEKLLGQDSQNVTFQRLNEILTTK